MKLIYEKSVEGRKGYFLREDPYKEISLKEIPYYKVIEAQRGILKRKKIGVGSRLGFPFSIYTLSYPCLVYFSTCFILAPYSLL